MSVANKVQNCWMTLEGMLRKKGSVPQAIHSG